MKKVRAAQIAVSRSSGLRVAVMRGAIEEKLSKNSVAQWDSPQCARIESARTPLEIDQSAHVRARKEETPPLRLSKRQARKYEFWIEVNRTLFGAFDPMGKAAETNLVAMGID